MTPAEFKTLFPEFKDKGTDVIQAKLNLATPHFNVSRWGDFYVEGLANYVAHEIVSAPATPAAGDADGTVTDKQVGSVRVARGAALLGKLQANPYLETKYGRRYWKLRMQVGMGALAA